MLGRRPVPFPPGKWSFAKLLERELLSWSYEEEKKQFFLTVDPTGEDEVIDKLF